MGQSGSEKRRECVKFSASAIHETGYARGLRSLEGSKAVSFSRMMKRSERVLDESRPRVASCIPNVDDEWNPSVMKHRLKRFVGFLAITRRRKTQNSLDQSRWL
jgi:hypothetical protein